VVRAAPDGYTVLLVDLSVAINATLYDKLNFVFLRDIVPIAGILRFPYVMITEETEKWGKVIRAANIKAE